MMSVWDLPHTLNVCGVDYEIREDFRAILDILSAFDDDELTDAEKTQVMIEILYPIIPPVKHLQEAVDKAIAKHKDTFSFNGEYTAVRAGNADAVEYTVMR